MWEEACIEASVRHGSADSPDPKIFVISFLLTDGAPAESGSFCAKIFRPSDEKGSAQKGAKITKARRISSLGCSEAEPQESGPSLDQFCPERTVPGLERRI
jgi:hypothetical protein